MCPPKNLRYKYAHTVYTLQIVICTLQDTSTQIVNDTKCVHGTYALQHISIENIRYEICLYNIYAFYHVSIQNVRKKYKIVQVANCRNVFVTNRNRMCIAQYVYRKCTLQNLSTWNVRFEINPHRVYVTKCIHTMWRCNRCVTEWFHAKCVWQYLSTKMHVAQWMCAIKALAW